jgi:hypothetical protein
LSTIRERKPPTVDIPLDEALEELTGFEIIAIGKRFKCHVTELDPLLSLSASVWAFENRDGRIRSWESVLAMSQREVVEYFADPAPDPDSDEGKEPAIDTTTTGT